MSLTYLDVRRLTIANYTGPLQHLVTYSILIGHFRPPVNGRQKTRADDRDIKR